MKIPMTLIAGLSLGACATAPAPEAAAPATPDPVQVMVVGSFHMGNPGQDLANAEIESMLTEHRQAEIAAIAEALSEFKPTVVAVERITKEPSYLDPKYAEFTPGKLLEIPDERYQIGYRLAHVMGIDRVYGIDEQPSDGEPDYFPFDKLMAHAQATGQGEKLQQQIADIQTLLAEFSARQKDHTVAELFLVMNRPGVMPAEEFYYQTFEYDRGEAQPGAELQAYWFMRNAKIFSKLMQVTKPGDRVVVVYGAGHKYWLEHFADLTPGFARVDPVPYFEKAATR